MECNSDPKTALVFAYFDYKENLPVQEVMASLFAQLMSQCEKLPLDLTKEYEQYEKKKTYKLTEDRVKEMFINCASMFSRVFIALDAFDEATLNARQALIETYLPCFYKSNLRVFITVRPPHFDQLKRAFPIFFQRWISADDNDIHAYLKNELRNQMLHDKLKDQIMNTLSSNAQGKWHLHNFLADRLDFGL